MSLKDRVNASLLRDICVILVLFLIALSVRLGYQREAIINGPIRSDAKEYFSIAYNLYKHNVYSAEFPSESNSPPPTTWRRPPGYPLFLYPFVHVSKTIVEFIQRVTFAQALLGSFTVVMTYLLARLYFGPPWALLGGLLTALSPHLVALDHYILTESLFTFTIVLASLVLVISWRKRKPALSALAGMLFAFSPLIRPVALLLGPFMAIVYLFDESSWIAASKRVLIAQLLCFSIGIAVIYVPYGVFRQKTIARAASVKCESLWTHFIRGSDINMKNFGRRQVDREYGAELNKMAQNRIYGLNVLKERFISSPLSYLKWYMGGKTLFLWRWDNIYNTDVYQYPMVRKGFETNPWLHGIHKSMRWLHWPLFLLMLTVPAFAFVNWRLGILTARTVILLTPVLMFSYFAIVLTLLMPLPRYAIPARPFVYVLAIYPLNQVWCYGKMGRQRLKAFLFR